MKNAPSLYLRLIQRIRHTPCACKSASATNADLDALEWHVERLERENAELKRRLRLTLRDVLDDVAKRSTDPLDRYEIAARMSRVLGREITKSHIDGWTAMSAIQRRIHADSLRALCQVVNDWRALHYYAESCGFKLVDPDMAQCAEFGALMLSKKGIDTNIREFLTRVDEKALLQSLMQRAVKGGEQ